MLKVTLNVARPADPSAKKRGAPNKADAATPKAAVAAADPKKRAKS